MVEIINAYQEQIEEDKEYNLMYELAEKLFPGRIRKKSLEKVLREIVIETDTKKVSVEIYPSFGAMNVKQKSDFEKAKELAEQGEKIINREFTLRTTYPC